MANQPQCEANLPPAARHQLVTAILRWGLSAERHARSIRFDLCTFCECEAQREGRRTTATHGRPPFRHHPNDASSVRDRLDAVDDAPRDRRQSHWHRAKPRRPSMMNHHCQHLHCYWRLAGFRRLMLGLKRGSTGLAYQRGVSNFLLLGAPLRAVAAALLFLTPFHMPREARARLARSISSSGRGSAAGSAGRL